MQEVQWYIQQNGLCFRRTANRRQKREKEANKQTNTCIDINSDHALKEESNTSSGKDGLNQREDIRRPQK